LSVLLIGDCLYLDVRGFLAPLALEDGISLWPTFLGNKNHAELRNALRKLAEARFDLIFYSPFTYEFSPEFTSLHNWRRSLAGRGPINRVVTRVVEELGKNLELLVGLLDVPAYVHNTANVRRHDSTLRELTRTMLARSSRRLARLEVNRRLAA
jgi:hypothetical protein